MEIIDKALEFETRKLSFQTTSDRIVASREVKSLILGVNEIYKENQDPELMDLMKQIIVFSGNIANTFNNLSKVESKHLTTPYK